MKKNIIYLLLILSSCNRLLNQQNSIVASDKTATYMESSKNELIEMTIQPTLTESIDKTSLSQVVNDVDNVTYVNFSTSWKMIYKGLVDCIDINNKNEIWVKTINVDNPDKVIFELKHFDGETWKTFFVPKEFNLENRCPYIQGDGSIFFYSNDNVLSNFISYKENDNWKLIPYPEVSNGLNQTTTKLIVSDYGRVWLGIWNCENSNSCLYQLIGDKWEKIQIPFASLSSLQEDSEGNIWISGNIFDGIAYYTGTSWNFYSTELLWNYTPMIGEEYKRIYIYQGYDKSIWAIPSANNNWIKLNTFGMERNIVYPLDGSRNNSLSLYEDSDQTVWYIFMGSELGKYDTRTVEWTIYDGLKSTSYLAGPSIVHSPVGETFLVLPNNANGDAGIYKYLPDNKQPD